MTARLLPILQYHHVGVRRQPRGHRTLWVSRRRFEEQMDILARENYRCIALRDALALLAATEAPPRRAAVLTFDDGYENFHEHAWPVLKRYGFQATVFVVTGEIGGVNRWDADGRAPLMDWTALREISEQGIEVGSHTVSHPRLTEISADEARRELAASRQVLEQNLGAPVLTLAYPFGDWNLQVEALARRAGYRLACSITRGNRHTPSDLLRLKRVPVDEFTGPERFRRKLTSIYDFTCRLRRWSRKFRHR
jgi:peptidoglycan/xylan/chitin deacetylase (PgdA/CDA1 family)